MWKKLASVVADVCSGRASWSDELLCMLAWLLWHATKEGGWRELLRPHARALLLPLVKSRTWHGVCWVRGARPSGQAPRHFGVAVFVFSFLVELVGDSELYILFCGSFLSALSSSPWRAGGETEASYLVLLRLFAEIRWAPLELAAALAQRRLPAQTPGD